MDFVQRQQKYQGMVEQALDACLQESAGAQPDVLHAMRYSLLDGGKRIRPILLLEFCRLCGGNVEAALPYACAVEMIHTYSLIHDDLPCMDNDTMRRGRPSNHVMFGEAAALLAGDALLTMAFEVMTREEAVEKTGAEKAAKAVLTLASKAGVGGMVGGQQIDLMSEGRGIELYTLRKMDEYKTGALICAAAQIGCIIAGATEKQVKAAEKYASSLGLAFQIVDDILDVTGTEEELGKPVRSDSQRDKCTYVSLMGLEEARCEAERLTNLALSELELFGEEGEFLRQLTLRLCHRKK